MQRMLPCVVLLMLAPAARAGDNEFFFKAADRIVFLGDSITEQYQYSTYLELYLTTRFPNGKMSFINAGIGGDTAGGGAKRFAHHVLAEKPTAVTINFGMNDAGYGKFNPAANQNFVKKTAAMLELAKKAGVRVALLSPNAVDGRIQERFKLYVETQKEFYAPLKNLAAEHGAAFVDQYAITRAATEKMAMDDPKAAKAKPYYDGFHTSPPGGLLMAHAILTGLKAPALVSDAVVNIEAMNVKSQVKDCKVEMLEAKRTTVAFSRLDNALPLPVQKDWLPMLPYISELKDLNWYGLTVAGLAEGKYTLSIDGKVVATFTSAELAKGVNVGNITTGPIFEQSQKVLQMINAKNQLVHKRFRGAIMAKTPDAANIAQRLEAINAQQALIYEAAQPKSHRWELKRAS